MVTDPTVEPGDVRRVTPQLLAKIGVVGLVIGSAIALVQHFTAPACAPMEDVPWAVARLDEIEASMGRAGKAEAWTATRAAIESFGARWDAAFVQACELPDDSARATAYACLAPSYSKAAALLDALRLLDPEALETADATIAAFASPEAC
jgi:hypothetical protein